MDNRYCCPCARAALSYAEKTVIELAEYAEKLELAVLAAAELYENHRLDPSYRGGRRGARKIVMAAAELARKRDLSGEIDRAQEPGCRGDPRFSEPDNKARDHAKETEGRSRLRVGSISPASQPNRGAPATQMLIGWPRVAPNSTMISACCRPFFGLVGAGYMVATF